MDCVYCIVAMQLTWIMYIYCGSTAYMDYVHCIVAVQLTWIVVGSKI